MDRWSLRCARITQRSADAQAAPRRRHQLAMAAAALGLLAGCWHADPFPMDQVSGVVKYEDGSLIPAERLVIRFEPLAAPKDERTHPKAATSVVNPEDGTFGELSTFRYGDGVVRGRHKVLLAAVSAEPSATREGGAPLVPLAYRELSTTPLKVDSGDAPFEFLIPKQ